MAPKPGPNGGNVSPVNAQPLETQPHETPMDYARECNPDCGIVEGFGGAADCLPDVAVDLPVSTCQGSVFRRSLTFMRFANAGKLYFRTHRGSATWPAVDNTGIRARACRAQDTGKWQTKVGHYVQYLNTSNITLNSMQSV